MNCPEKKILQDLVDCELSEEQHIEVIAHIKSCDKCRGQLKQMLVFYRALSDVVAMEACPSKDELENFAHGKLSLQNSDRVREHIVLCAQCESYVQLFQATDEQLAEQAEREKVIFQKAAAQGRAYDAARVILKKLLPDKVSVFDSLWEHISGVLEEMLESKSIKGLSFGDSGEFAGALGFSGVPDPQTAAAAIIIGTTLATAYSLGNTVIASDPAAIKQTVSDIAGRLGAGKELKKRLAETVPLHFIDI